MSGSPFVDRLVARTAAADVAISQAQAHQLERYYDLLRQWNRRINLTALPLDVPPGDDTLDRLFLESLIAATLVDDQPGELFGGGRPDHTRGVALTDDP